MQTAEGRLRKDGTAWVYEYNLKDHLGNIRVSFDKNPSTGLARLIQKDNYYPFGGTFNSYTSGVENKYKFQGIELQNETETYLADYGSYDPWLGRWQQVDPKANEFESPYVGMGNNPLKFADPLGDTVIYFIDNQAAQGNGHMGMAFQNGDGAWFYASQGAAGDAGNEFWQVVTLKGG